jgi:predicted RecB family nuclease
LYALAYREVHGRLPDRMELHFLNPEAVVVGVVRPEEEWVRRAEEVIDRVSEGIRRQDFTATPDWYRACRYCAFASICPYTARGE